MPYIGVCFFKFTFYTYLYFGTLWVFVFTFLDIRFQRTTRIQGL